MSGLLEEFNQDIQMSLVSIYLYVKSANVKTGQVWQTITLTDPDNVWFPSKIQTLVAHIQNRNELMDEESVKLLKVLPQKVKNESILIIHKIINNSDRIKDLEKTITL